MSHTATSPRLGRVRFGSLRRKEPISRVFGYDRGGTRIGRHFIDGFIERHAGDIRGRTLEIGDDRYTRRFGGDRVDRCDVLHAEAGIATFSANAP